MSLQTIYVGRLDEEKGIAHLIAAMTILLWSQQDITLHVYGAGSYTEEIKKLAQDYPSNIFYHGWQNKNTILKQRKKMDYFIMPSQFLETFWLTACESLLCGVPVIGNKKWWLIPFIDDRLDIGQYEWTDDGERLSLLLQYLIDKKLEKKNFSDIIHQTKATYTKESRYRQIKKLLPLAKDIVFINDYINYNGGGIETHIHDAIAIVQNHHHTTHLYGHYPLQWRFTLILKFCLMGLSIINIPDTLKIQQIIEKKDTWLVWWHSISRVIGWLPLAFSNHKNQIITYHELGLFHPYPSKVDHIHQIPEAWWLN